MAGRDPGGGADRRAGRRRIRQDAARGRRDGEPGAPAIGARRDDAAAGAAPRTARHAPGIVQRPVAHARRAPPGQLDRRCWRPRGQVVRGRRQEGRPRLAVRPGRRAGGADARAARRRGRRRRGARHRREAAGAGAAAGKDDAGRPLRRGARRQCERRGHHLGVVRPGGVHAPRAPDGQGRAPPAAAGLGDAARQPHLVRLHQPAAGVLRTGAATRGPAHRRHRLRAARDPQRASAIRLLRRA